MRLQDLSQRSRPLWDVGVLLGCLAGGLRHLLADRAQQPPDSVWFGRARGRRRAVPAAGAGADLQRACWCWRSASRCRCCELAVPVLIALAGIRLLARVFTVVFPDSARGPPGRAGLLLAGLDRRGAVDHGLAAGGDGGDGRHPASPSASRKVSLLQPGAGRAVGRRGAGARAVDFGRAGAARAAPDTCSDLSLRKVGGQCDPRGAAAGRPAVRAVGGGRRPDGAVGAGRRARRRPGLRPAEAGRQLRQRLRDPVRAQPAHRRHGARWTASRAW